MTNRTLEQLTGLHLLKWALLIVFGFFTVSGALILMRGPSGDPPELTCQRFCASDNIFLTEQCSILSCTWTCTCQDGRVLEGIR